MCYNPLRFLHLGWAKLVQETNSQCYAEDKILVLGGRTAGGNAMGAGGGKPSAGPPDTLPTDAVFSGFTADQKIHLREDLPCLLLHEKH